MIEIDHGIGPEAQQAAPPDCRQFGYLALRFGIVPAWLVCGRQPVSLAFAGQRRLRVSRWGLVGEGTLAVSDLG